MSLCSRPCVCAVPWRALNSLRYGTLDAIPLHLEAVLREQGGIFSKADKDYDAFVVVDGDLYTGQNVSLPPPLLRFASWRTNQQVAARLTVNLHTITFACGHTQQPASAAPLAERVKAALLAA